MISKREGRPPGVQKPGTGATQVSTHTEKKEREKMSISTWQSITTGMHEATYRSYMRKSTRQRARREVSQVMSDVDGFCAATVASLADGSYRVGPYRHFTLRDRKKVRPISVLPYSDRCVQNCLKDAIERPLLKQMTDDMMGGLPGCGVVAGDSRHSVVEQVRRTMNNRGWQYVLQGDISKFYDHVDNVVSMRLIERQVKDRRTLGVVRQHLMNQKRLAIGDPFSHLIANLNMSVVIRKAKQKYGRRVRIINFADDFLAFSRDRSTANALRRDMKRWARELRMHYKPMYVRPIDARPGRRRQPVIFCGYQFGRGYVKIAQHTKKKYARARHRRRAIGSYNGLLKVADTRHLRNIIEFKNNGAMTQKIRRPFAGRPMKVETMEGISHTIVDFARKVSSQKDCECYYHVQAIADGLGLIVYSTGSKKIGEYLSTKTRADIPLRNMKIVHDWSGYYYDGTVYTDAEEEEMIRRRYNI